MHSENINHVLLTILDQNLSKTTSQWIASKTTLIVDHKSTKDLYLTYSLLASKVTEDQEWDVDFTNTIITYLKSQKANLLQIVRLSFLVQLLDADEGFFAPRIAKIIQVADTQELETFLKFLVLLPNAIYYKPTAVDALRTNIAVVFDAIAMNNPYPGRYFNEQEWNQMYLKAAFMERDLTTILDVDKMANKDLTRIISDYAHERWAASRDVNPYFWRPVSSFIDDTIAVDMKRLLESNNITEKRAGLLCCESSSNTQAKVLLDTYNTDLQEIKNNDLSWDTLLV